MTNVILFHTIHDYIEYKDILNKKKVDIVIITLSEYAKIVNTLPRTVKELYIYDINLFEHIRRLPLHLEYMRIGFNTAYFAWLQDAEPVIKQKNKYINKIKSLLPYGCKFDYYEE